MHLPLSRDELPSKVIRVQSIVETNVASSLVCEWIKLQKNMARYTSRIHVYHGRSSKSFQSPCLPSESRWISSLGVKIRMPYGCNFRISPFIVVIILQLRRFKGQSMIIPAIRKYIHTLPFTNIVY